VAFDIDPTPRFVEKVEQRERRADSRSIARILQPRSVAVIGASDRPGSVGRAVFRNLLGGAFDGPVYPVNPFTAHVASVPTWDRVQDIPDDVHLAVVAVPAEEVEQVVVDCAEKRVRGVVVISTGFSDLGTPEGLEREQRLVHLARSNGMRLLGPASMGFVRWNDDGCLVASFTQAPVRRGNLAVSLQSGPLGSAMLEHASKVGLGISSFVSLGNKADISANDLLTYWEDDPDTGVIAVYTESFGNPRKFARIARRVSRKKPIVAVKAGRGGADDVATDALYLEAGVIRVDTVRQLFDTARVLATQPLPAGDRVAVLSNALSPARLALDSLHAAGLVPARLSADTLAELSHSLPAQARVESAIDLTFRASPADYRHALDTVLADPGVDAVVVIHAPPLVDSLDEVAATITESAARARKAVVAVRLGGDDGRLTEDGAIPAFAFPETAVAALGRVARYADWRRRPEGEEPELDDVRTDAAEALVDEALNARPVGTLLPIRKAGDLLAAYGIGVGQARGVTTLDDALEAAHEVGYPVALKAAGIERLARSEAGGVALDLQDADDLAGAYTRMRSALGLAMAEAIVQRMVPAGVEVMVSIDAHPAFGSVITFGLGGAFADAIADRNVRALPVTDVDARDLVAGARAHEALLRAGADLSAIQDLLVRVARLVEDLPQLDRMVLNPVLCSASGAWVVDARIHVHPVEEGLPADVPLRRLT